MIHRIFNHHASTYGRDFKATHSMAVAILVSNKTKRHFRGCDGTPQRGDIGLSESDFTRLFESGPNCAPSVALAVCFKSCTC